MMMSDALGRECPLEMMQYRCVSKHEATHGHILCYNTLCHTVTL